MDVTTMSALTEFLYPTPARRTVGSIIVWWEKRRLPYNIAVGTAGLFSMGYGSLVALLPPGGGLALPPLILPVVFGVMANVCYLFGPATELFIEKLWGPRVLPTGPALFRIGLTFSVGLALFPALLVTIGWVFRIVFSIL